MVIWCVCACVCVRMYVPYHLLNSVENIASSLKFMHTKKSETSILCKTPRGLLFGYGFIATVGTRAKTLSDAFSYDASYIYENFLGNGPTSGGSVVTVKGQSYGWLDMTTKLRYGGTACDSTRWLSTTALLCTIPEGNGIMKSVTVSVHFLRTTLSRAFSYDRLVLEMAYMQTSNMATSLNASNVIIIGDNFGADPLIASSMMVHVGGSACEMSRWISTTSVFCKQTNGVGSTYQIVLTSRFRITSLSNALSFDNPSLSYQSSHTNSYSNSSLLLSIAGSGIGNTDVSQKLRVSATTCVATLWMSMTSISARMAFGSSAPHGISVTAGLATGTVSQAHSFDGPRPVKVDLVNQPKIGRVIVHVQGSAFGRNDFSPALRISSLHEYSLGNFTQLRGHGTASMTTLWTSETAIAAKSARGQSTSASIVVTVTEQLSSLSDALSFDKPDKILPSPPNSPTLGRFAVIAAQGANFGWIDVCAKIRIGGTAAERTTWMSDSEMGCRVSAGAPSRNAHGLVLTVLGVKSGTCHHCFSYNIPYALSAQHANHPTSGRSQLSLTGVNFGSIMDHSGVSRFGISSSGSTNWFSDSSIVCTIAAGVSGLLPIVVTWDSSVSTQSMAFTYNRPQVLFISRLYSSPSGGDKVSISGRFFGSADYSPVAYVDYEQCVSSVWSSDSSLSCGVPRGYGPGRGVAVGVAQEVGQAAIIFEYQGQHILDRTGLPWPSHEFLRTWLAADTLKLEPGSQLLQWKDSSAAGADATASNSPTYLERRVNDLPAVRVCCHFYSF